MKIQTLIALLLCPYLAQADILYWPQVQGTAQYISIDNKSSEPQVLWFQIKSSHYFEEKRYEVPAQSHLQIEEKEISPTGLEYAMKTNSTLLKITHSSGMIAENLSSSEVVFRLDKGMTQLPMALLNLNFQPQKLNITYLDSKGVSLKVETILSKGYFQSDEQTVTVPQKTQSLKIKGEGRFQARIFQGHWVSPEVTKTVTVNVPKNQSYFLVANPQKTDSFIIALSNIQQIQKARELAQSPNDMIVFGRITASTDSWNRPLLGSSTPWSWTVTEVTNFAEIASIACDGSPSLVEEQLPIWLLEERICFWNFRVIRELQSFEIERGLLQD